MSAKTQYQKHAYVEAIHNEKTYNPTIENLEDDLSSHSINETEPFPSTTEKAVDDKKRPLYVNDEQNKKNFKPILNIVIPLVTLIFVIFFGILPYTNNVAKQLGTLDTITSHNKEDINNIKRDLSNIDETVTEIKIDLKVKEITNTNGINPQIDEPIQEK